MQVGRHEWTARVEEGRGYTVCAAAKLAKVRIEPIERRALMKGVFRLTRLVGLIAAIGLS
jgi:hypothetical protein